MSRTRKFARFLLFLLPALAAPPGAPAQTAQPGEAAEFALFVRGRQIGTERVSIESSPAGWTIRGSNRMAPPVDLTLSEVEIRYDQKWSPVSLRVEGEQKNAAYSLQTSFSGGSASNRIRQGTETTQKTDPVSADAVVLPNNFFGSYEALAARLSGAEVGSVYPAYVAAQGEASLRVTDIAAERIQTADRTFELRRHSVSFENIEPQIAAEIWVDDRGRLARVTLPSVSLDFVRRDIASVSSRRLTYWREGDRDIRIPANGFTLAGTLSHPAPEETRPVKHPAVVMIGHSGDTDRDELVGGVPVLGQLSGQLADQGFIVVRYDRRGLGQSGGRDEAATLRDYAEDVRSVVRFLDDRKDVDDRRIILAGRGDGAAIALLAASREKRVAGVVTIGAIATSGASFVLEQQRARLERSGLEEAERNERIALQERIHEAVLSGEGWDDLPEGLRRQADTPWFRSYLTYDPAEVLDKVRQPILVIHGSRDTQVAARHGDELLPLAEARDKGRRKAEGVTLEDVDERLMRVDGSGTPLDETITAEVATHIRRWFDETPVRR